MREKKLLVTCVPPLIVDNHVRRVGKKEVNCQMGFYFGWNYLRILEDFVADQPHVQRRQESEENSLSSYTISSTHMFPWFCLRFAVAWRSNVNAWALSISSTLRPQITRFYSAIEIHRQLYKNMRLIVSRNRVSRGNSVFWISEWLYETMKWYFV